MQVIIFVLLTLLTNSCYTPKYTWVAQCKETNTLAVSFPYQNLENATDSLHYFLDEVCIMTLCDTLDVFLYKDNKQVKQFPFVCLD